MLDATDTIRAYFAKLGLDPEIADIYFSLYGNGPQTISELSRTSGVERTRIYRLIDQLLESNLIEVEPAGSAGARSTIKAAPVSNLRTIITEREQETKNLADELDLIEKVLSHNSLSNPAAAVRLFSGSEGIRQMLRHELECKSEHLCYLHPTAGGAAGTKFMDFWHGAFETKGLTGRILNNTMATDSGDAITPTNECTATRYIDNEIYTITHRISVYDETVAHYLWKDGRAYGVELRNKEIAGRERQLFELLWTPASPATP